MVKGFELFSITKDMTDQEIINASNKALTRPIDLIGWNTRRKPLRADQYGRGGRPSTANLSKWNKIFRIQQKNEPIFRQRIKDAETRIKNRKIEKSKKQKEQVSQEVINQTGKNYFRRNTYRTNGLNVYSRPPLEQQQKKGIDLKFILLIAGVGLAGLIIVMRLKK